MRKAVRKERDVGKAWNVEKVWEEIARMKERRYVEGPYDEKGDNIYMTHPLAAVGRYHGVARQC